MSIRMRKGDLLLIDTFEPGAKPSLAGGKVYWTSQLIELGWTVPPGFWLSIEAMQLFLEEAGLRDPIVDLYNKGDSANLAELDSLAKPLRHRVRTGKIPIKIRQEFEHALAELGPGEWESGFAFRSSAVGEDQIGRSAAGCYQTFLTESTSPDWQTYVKECWASGFGLPALTYALSNPTFQQKPHLMSVLVQHRVPGDISGTSLVGYRDLQSELEDEELIAIEALRGMCNRLVSGIVTPDYFLIDGVTFDLIQHRRGRDSEPPLTEHQAQDLARRFTLLKSQIGMNIEIEWTLYNKRLILLQTRPYSG